ncbi:hypothetical protein CKAH01_10173 [Colletotrichum kahawae]|uniref:Uncharacterized protein n=1 Tax=Colletotrichum kahawae TaxID=34407 RepID=A0AAD9XXZ6_COLKA|nr:hypothetical protein CKAH01_10173 [Colletotrichum kahawae]
MEILKALPVPQENVFLHTTDLPVDGCDLPGPENQVSQEDAWWGGDIPASAPGGPVPKGSFGALLRKLKGVPACVWVVNQHDEEITVVVSKHRPCRMLTGFEVNLSTTGGGIGLSQTTYVGPATKKTLQPESKTKSESRATFPLWTSKDGFAVVTVFIGQEKRLHIENDRILAGATAYVGHGPDLRIEPYGQASD